MAADRDLPWESVFEEEGGELMIVLFKSAFYGSQIQYSVENGEKCIAEEHS
jgi:hypothetical protein